MNVNKKRKQGKKKNRKEHDKINLIWKNLKERGYKDTNKKNKSMKDSKPKKRKEIVKKNRDKKRKKDRKKETQRKHKKEDKNKCKRRKDNLSNSKERLKKSNKRSYNSVKKKLTRYHLLLNKTVAATKSITPETSTSSISHTSNQMSPFKIKKKTIHQKNLSRPNKSEKELQISNTLWSRARLRCSKTPFRKLPQCPLPTLCQSWQHGFTTWQSDENDYQSIEVVQILKNTNIKKSFGHSKCPKSINYVNYILWQSMRYQSVRKFPQFLQVC